MLLIIINTIYRVWVYIYYVYRLSLAAAEKLWAAGPGTDSAAEVEEDEEDEEDDVVPEVEPATEAAPTPAEQATRGKPKLPVGQHAAESDYPVIIFLACYIVTLSSSLIACSAKIALAAQAVKLHVPASQKSGKKSPAPAKESQAAKSKAAKKSAAAKAKAAKKSPAANSKAAKKSPAAKSPAAGIQSYP